MAAAMESASEAELMRACGPLFVPIALESLATTLMITAFGYLLLLITNKGRLQEPGKAFAAVIRKRVSVFCTEIYSEIKNWHTMGNKPLQERFAMCRKANQAICTIQIVIGVLTIERWLHIHNVNGFRYLGYSITCPPMMAELIILIGPVIPCFKMVTIYTYFMTFAMLITGYVASVMSGEFYLGNVSTYVETWALDDLQPTEKFWWMMISTGLLLYLSFIQIPVLAVIYICKGGVKADLPHGYLRLLSIVAVSWLAFPVWWCFSYEGMAILKDTKLNSFVFAILNVVAKGSFTLQMLRMTKWHRAKKLREECLQKGLRPSVDGKVNLFDPDKGLARNSKRVETWLVKMLRPYDSTGSGDQFKSSEEWSAMDPNYKAYLVGQGMTPTQWKNMDDQAKEDRRSSYMENQHLFISEGPDPNKQAASRIGGVPKIGDAENSQYMTSGGLGDVVGVPRLGQLVTLVRGEKGRVLKVAKDAVQVVVKGNQPEMVCLNSLVVLKVLVMGVRGLSKSRGGSGMMRYRCSALVYSLPASEVQTRPRQSATDRAKWDEELQVHGFFLKDQLTLRVWGTSDPEVAEDVLGEVTIEGTHLLESGYEGELQLSLEGELTPVFLSIAVVPVDLAGKIQEFDLPALSINGDILTF